MTQLGNGQMVRLLILDQVILGSSPSSPAKLQDRASEKKRGLFVVRFPTVLKVLLRVALFFNFIKNMWMVGIKLLNIGITGCGVGT